MTQPVSSYRPDRSQDVPPEADAGRPTQPATRVAAPQSPPSIPELPDTNAAFVANAVKAATSSAPHLMLAMGVKGPDVDTVRDAPIQQRLDAFKDSATPTFHTKDGDVQVGIPFRMTPQPGLMSREDAPAQPFIRQERTARANAGELQLVARDLGLSQGQLAAIASGRGTPETIRLVTQALIDRGKLPSGGTAEVGARIRTMMCNYGVGLDCAGYVQQAFLASRGIPRAETGLRPVLRENLTGLASRGFSPLPPSSAPRAGDIFILKPPHDETVGHTMIVRDSRTATVAETQNLMAIGAQQVARDPSSLAWVQHDPSKLQRIELDSSWGNGADAQVGGVKRQTFWHDTENDRWIRQDGGAYSGVEPADELYFGHSIEGFYRPSKES
jgi:hypothetical protein